MIATTTEYQKARSELSEVETRLRCLEQAHPAGDKGITKTGIRKTIGRLLEELAVYEGSEEAKRPESN